MDIRKTIKEPDIQYWPEVRWWLAEGMHTDVTLKKDISELHDAGFGAVEFLAMEEPGADSKLYGWGSEEWVHDTHTIVDETTQRGMGVSMTSGTNWSNANLIGISPDERSAAQELDYVAVTVKAGERFEGTIPKPVPRMPGVKKQTLLGVVAAAICGTENEKKILDKNRCHVVSKELESEEICYQAPDDGDYELFFFYIHGTGQTAAPSVDVSYTINYMDPDGVEAFKRYWDKEVLTEELRQMLTQNGRGMMYMDSLELMTYADGGQLFGFSFAGEFERRRGYDVIPYLPFLVKQPGMMLPVHNYHYVCSDKEWFERLENDFYQTTTDLYMDHMLRPMQEWLHQHQMSLRSEISYGLPFEISQPAKYVDGVETESLEFASQIEAYRGLAGAAHIYHRTFSSETGATMLNYMKGLDFYNQIIFTQMAAGVTKTVLHGYSSICGSEKSTYWPGHEGMWPMFSERFGSRQPAFIHYKDWTKMIARCQMVLRQGVSRIDLGILRTDYNFNNSLALGYGESEEDIYENRLMRDNKGLYWRDMQLQNAGYTYEYFSPYILEEDFTKFENGRLYDNGPGYRALIVYQEYMPLAAARRLLKLAEEGLPVIFVNHVTEEIRPVGIEKYHEKAASKVPGLSGEDEELKNVIEQIKAFPQVCELDDQAQTLAALQSMQINPAAGYEAPNKNLLTTTTQDGKDRYIFVYNMQYTETKPYENTLVIDTVGKPYEVDCWNGELIEIGQYTIEENQMRIPVTLAPGQAKLYRIAGEETCGIHVEDTDAWRVTTQKGLALEVCHDGTYRATLSDQSKKTVSATVLPEITIPQWHLQVEDWDAGEKRVITEDRGKGIVTREVYYETKKSVIDAGTVNAVPWKEIPAVGETVSGIGRYTAIVEIPAAYSSDNGYVLQMESIEGNTGAVYVNGKKCGVLDFEALKMDISDYLQAGKNEIMIEVSTTLNNRLKAQEYFAKAMERSLACIMEMAGGGSADGETADEMAEEMPEEASLSGEMSGQTEEGTGGEMSEEEIKDSMPTQTIQNKVRDYGLTGEVKLIPYTRIKL